MNLDRGSSRASSSLEQNTRNSFIGLSPLLWLHRRGAVHDRTTGLVLPGGVHEDFIEVFESGEGTTRDGYKLVVS
jgi:hypothetical protein